MNGADMKVGCLGSAWPPWDLAALVCWRKDDGSSGPFLLTRVDWPLGGDEKGS